MTQLKNPTAGGAPTGVELHIDDLTRDQRNLLVRLTQKFMESAAAQVLVGPSETGKSTLGQMVGQCLHEQVEAIYISKSLDPAGNQKRLMFEAYGSYNALLSAILKQLGFFARGEDDDLVAQLVEQLRRLRSENRRLLLIIDDAEEVSSAVWKRLQSWMDYQDRGARMMQVLMIGKPEFKKKLSEAGMRGWRRCVQNLHELHLISRWKKESVQEAQRMLKRACDLINEKTQPAQPIQPPQITWPAVQKIVKEAGGRPGRMHELIKRTLSASLRKGGQTIGYRFLSQADALRSPAMQWYNLRQAESTDSTKAAKHKKKWFFIRPGGKSMKERTKNPRIPAHPLAWMRYALGMLLVVFALGAGWGVTSWLSIDADPSDVFILAEEAETTPMESPASDSSVAAADPWGAAPIESDASVATASGEPSSAYPLDVFNDEWKVVESLADSRTASASLEQKFQSLESSGFPTLEGFPASEMAAMESTPPVAETVPPTVAASATAPAATAPVVSPLDSLEEMSLPERSTPLEEVVKVEAEPLNAEALDIPKNLLNQTAPTETVSLPPAAPIRSTPKQSTTAAAPGPPRENPAPSQGGGRSRERLLQAMSKLEKSLK